MKYVYNVKIILTMYLCKKQKQNTVFWISLPVVEPNTLARAGGQVLAGNILFVLYTHSRRNVVTTDVQNL